MRKIKIKAEFIISAIGEQEPSEADIIKKFHSTFSIADDNFSKVLYTVKEKWIELQKMYPEYYCIANVGGYVFFKDVTYGERTAKHRKEIRLFEKVIWKYKTCIVTNASIGRGKYIEVSPIGENKYYQVTPEEINFTN